MSGRDFATGERWNAGWLQGCWQWLFTILLTEFFQCLIRRVLGLSEQKQDCRSCCSLSNQANFSASFQVRLSSKFL
ncbi:hypothetical protein GUJ93_ZPchr0010g8960 [Zizania palustris]|uniref:Uncharacterized protein n=1 Tax=Zizania palustris TaxID=103762 RepID=A0A8J5SZ37_ZIZPA|nr:hypothetical protein GUJ93_ZPchr0010g8960 [Zizania palustris]